MLQCTMFTIKFSDTLLRCVFVCVYGFVCLTYLCDVVYEIKMFFVINLENLYTFFVHLFTYHTPRTYLIFIFIFIPILILILILIRLFDFFYFPIQFQFLKQDKLNFLSRLWHRNMHSYKLIIAVKEGMCQLPSEDKMANVKPLIVR